MSLHLIRALIPSREPTYDLITSLKAPLSDTITLEIRVSTYGFGGDINIQSIALTPEAGKRWEDYLIKYFRCISGITSYVKPSLTSSHQ